jgi:hypothetical protein
MRRHREVGVVKGMELDRHLLGRHQLQRDQTQVLEFPPFGQGSRFQALEVIRGVPRYPESLLAGCLDILQRNKDPQEPPVLAAVEHYQEREEVVPRTELSRLDPIAVDDHCALEEGVQRFAQQTALLGQHLIVAEEAGPFLEHQGQLAAFLLGHEGGQLGAVLKPDIEDSLEAEAKEREEVQQVQELRRQLEKQPLLVQRQLRR